jgi:hypothetical protein
MRKVLCVWFLMLALSGSALAGDMNSPPAPASNGKPCTPRASGMRATENWNEEPAADDLNYGDSAGSIAAAALAALDGMLTLF